MDADQIRQLRLAQPFKPFNLVLRNGRKLPVDRPDALAVSSDGRLLVFKTFDNWFEQVSPDGVCEVDFDLNLGEVRRQRMLEGVGRR